MASNICRPLVPGSVEHSAAQSVAGHVPRRHGGGGGADQGLQMAERRHLVPRW